MEQVVVEMSIISNCSILGCSYNIDSGCHAKAITIGDDTNPSCDTFLHTDAHCKDTDRTAGVGACKITGCNFNDDLECTASRVSIGFKNNDINCLTYKAKV